MRRHILFLCGPIAFGLLSVSSCRPRNTDLVTVRPGVIFRRDRSAGIQLLDVDLQTARVRPVVVAQNVERRRNNFIGDCKTVREWAVERKAIGGINGGFFGDIYDQIGRRKQIVGLAVVDGKVIAPATMVESTRYVGQKYLRSALGFTREGMPNIGYATGTLREPPRRYAAAVNPESFETWDMQFAVGCGPRLIREGQVQIGDKEERLVSPGRLSRTFVAYDRENDAPRHLLLGRADAMEYAEIATFLLNYFEREHQSVPAEAMCLDGGPSSQLVYENQGTLEDAEPTGVLVPTAVLLLPQ